MKKIILAAVACAAMGFAFAEGSAWDVNGYFRSGIEGNTEGKNVKTRTFKDGKYYGNGTSRARLNINFTQEEYGFKFRYQNDKFGLEKNSEEKNEWFNGRNISYMFGYAKFCDGKVVAEAGKLMDFYTQSEARFEYQAIGDYGVRAVVVPVDGLFLSAAATTYRAESYDADDDEVVDGKATAGDIKFNEKILTLSAKYKNKDFAIAGGYNLAGEAYGFFALKAVPNLKFNIEAKYLDKEISKKTNDDGEKTAMTEAWELMNYNFKGMGVPLEAGVYFHQILVKDDNVIEFFPHLSYAINDVVSPEFEVGIAKYSNGDKHLDKDGEEQTMSYNVTPSIKFTAGKRATVKVYYNYDKNDKSSFGTTLRVNY
ncbi:MAG: hypothetical protein KIG77_00875 [Treponema sp.]|uniref:hypothetical protein n=1 Tax=Treponema sp. TaxID=166 RepID=UPI001DDCC83F|nr:hypothetical protein [Treponema sp.]MBS7240916.1 hypothetical protein [Treponema sp.]